MFEGGKNVNGDSLQYTIVGLVVLCIIVSGVTVIAQHNTQNSLDSIEETLDSIEGEMGAGGGGAGGGGAGEGLTLKVAAFSDLSGPGSAQGKPQYLAAKMAGEDINEAGLDGFKSIIVKHYDTEGRSNGGISAAKKAFLQDGMQAGWGAMSSSVELPVSQQAERYKVPYQTNNCSSWKLLTNDTGWTFRTMWSSRVTGLTEFKYLRDAGVETYAFIGGDYTWPHTIFKVLKYHAKQAGMKCVYKTFTPLDKTDFSTEIAKLKEKDPDGLGLGYLGAGQFPFLQQMAEANAKPDTIIGGITFQGARGPFEEVGTGMIGIAATLGIDPESADYQDLYTRYKERRGAPPAWSTVSGYASMWSIAKAAEKAQSNDPADIASAMRNMEYNPPWVHYKIGPFSESGQNISVKGLVGKYVEGPPSFDSEYDIHREVIQKLEIEEFMTREEVEDMLGL